jgi:uncharacterized repeat protein (TIGR01451 family)
MRIDQAKSRSGAPRLIGFAAILLAILVTVMVAYSGGATAAPGDADLSITKTDSPDPIVKGNLLTYTITVTNNGPLAATNVVVTDNLPAPSDIDYVSATTTAGSCQKSGNTVTCNLGTLANTATATVTIVVNARKSGTLSNTATVGSPEDNTPANNSATAVTTVTNPGQGNNNKNNPNKVRVSCATPTITGTAGDDVITGTDHADVIVTLGGNDQVSALGGKDLVCTGAGFDTVFGGFGGDTIIGGADPDRLVGNGGGDLLKGKAGRDALRGKSGNDVLNGGRNRDSCKGGAGRDVLKRCP